VKEIFYGLKLSFSYFSILPIKFKYILQSDKIDRAFLFFIPFVGGVIALISTFLYLFLSSFFPNLYAALLSISLYLFLYGFLHLEAVIDTIDALFASHSNKDAYKIIKEPTVGAIGVVFITLFIILKITLISYLFVNSIFLEFITAAIFSRLSIILVLRYFPIHKNSSLATLLKKALTKRIFWDMLVLYALLGVVLSGGLALALIAAIVAFTPLLARYLYKRLNLKTKFYKRGYLRICNRSKRISAT